METFNIDTKRPEQGLGREELLELVAQMTKERMELIARAEKAESQEQTWCELYMKERTRNGKQENLCDRVSDR